MFQLKHFQLLFKVHRTVSNGFILHVPMTNISVARASVFQKIDFAMDMTIVSISAMNSIVQVLTKYFSPYTILLINNSHIIEAKILRNKLFIDF